MLEVLRTNCVMSDELGDHQLYPASAAGDEVTSLADSSPEIVEAMEWLVPRRLAKTDRDERGEFIVVLNRG